MSGVWVVYDYDLGPYARAVYATEIAALRRINDDGYGHVCHWPFGADLSAAIDAAPGKGSTRANGVPGGDQRVDDGREGQR